PGYERLGLAVLEMRSGNPVLIHSECFETSNKTTQGERLLLISNYLDKIFKKFKPERVGIESLLFSKNVKTAMKVAEARGVILTSSAKQNIVISEYNPNTIKLAVTGYGKSDKKQIEIMLDKILKIKKKIKYDDEYDTIAVALTCSVIHKNSGN